MQVHCSAEETICFVPIFPDVSFSLHPEVSGDLMYISLLTVGTSGTNSECTRTLFCHLSKLTVIHSARIITDTSFIIMKTFDTCKRELSSLPSYNHTLLKEFIMFLMGICSAIHKMLCSHIVLQQIFSNAMKQ